MGGGHKAGSHIRQGHCPPSCLRRAVSPEVLPTFTTVGLVLTAWAFTHLGVKHDPLLPALGNLLLTTGRDAPLPG